jgi:hypothetical protein
MEKKPDQWHEIVDLIRMDKKRALADFHRQEFAPGGLSGGRTAPRLRWRPVMQPVPLAVAASLLLTAGLILFWSMHGSWRNVSAAPGVAQILADSMLYSQAGIGDRNASSPPLPPAANPFFSAWVEAGLTAAVADVPVEPSSSIELGNPVKVRRRIEQAIAENVFERMLLSMQEFQNTEV